MRSCCSSQKQNPFFSGNLQKFHNPFLGLASVDEALEIMDSGFQEKLHAAEIELPVFRLIGRLITKKSELFQIQFSNVMSMACVVFRISSLKIRYDLSRGRVGRSVSWSFFKRLEQLNKTQ